MGGVEVLYEKARRNPANLRFSQAVRLAEAAGFEEARVRGSHHIFRHRSRRALLINLQDAGGQAKPYQVRQLVGLIEELGLLEER